MTPPPGAHPPGLKKRGMVVFVIIFNFLLPSHNEPCSGGSVSVLTVCT